MPILPSPTARTRSLPLIALPFVPSAFVLPRARDPGRLHFEIAVEQHEIGAIALGDPAQFMVEAQKLRGMKRRHPQCILDTDAEMPHRVADRSRHIEVRSGESPGNVDQRTVDSLDLLAQELEMVFAAADR